MDIGWRAPNAGEFVAPIVVNAAGAWADDVAARAGAATQSVQPCRRTAVLVELDGGVVPNDWPMTIDIDERFYFKPDAGLLLISPADEAPVAACDVQPDELDIAVAIHRVESVTTLNIRRIRRKWAGELLARLRAGSRTADRLRSRPCRILLAGRTRGGYGIQTAPAAAKLAAALIRREELPASLCGFDPALVSPARGRVTNKVAASA